MSFPQIPNLGIGRPNKPVDVRLPNRQNPAMTGDNKVTPLSQPKPDEPALIGTLSRLIKTQEDMSREMRILRETLSSLAVNNNQAYVLRFDMARTNPLVFKPATYLGGPASAVSALSLGTSGTLQVRTSDMGDTDFATVSTLGVIFERERIDELVVKSNPAGTGTALLRFNAWVPPRGV